MLPGDFGVLVAAHWILRPLVVVGDCEDKLPFEYVNDLTVKKQKLYWWLDFEAKITGDDTW